MIDNDAELFKWVHIVSSLSRFVYERDRYDDVPTVRDDLDGDRCAMNCTGGYSSHPRVFCGEHFMHSLLDIIEIAPGGDMLHTHELMQIMTFVLRERENRLIATGDTKIYDFVLKGLQSTNERMRDSSIEVLGLLASEQDHLLRIISDPTLMEALHLKVFSEGQKRYKTLKLLAKLCMNGMTYDIANRCIAFDM
jgi:hypothetical protein